MAGDLDVAVRLSLQGGPEVRAELAALGAQGAESFERLRDGADGSADQLAGSLAGIGTAASQAGQTAGTALTEMARTGTEALSELEGFAQQSFGRFEDALIDLTFKGRAQWRAMAKGMAEDFARLVLRQSITEPLARAASSGLQSLAGGLFAASYHDGGTVGAGESDRQVRVVPAPLFAGAARLHAGSLPRLAPDEVPAILQTGEMVLNRRQAEAVRAAAPADPDGGFEAVRMTAPAPASGPVYVVNVDARGADGEGEIEARVEQAVAVALARQVPGIVRASTEIAQRRVVDDYRRRGGRFG